MNTGVLPENVDLPKETIYSSIKGTYLDSVLKPTGMEAFGNPDKPIYKYRPRNDGALVDLVSRMDEETRIAIEIYKNGFEYISNIIHLDIAFMLNDKLKREKEHSITIDLKNMRGKSLVFEVYKK